MNILYSRTKIGYLLSSPYGDHFEDAGLGVISKTVKFRLPKCGKTLSNITNFDVVNVHLGLVIGPVRIRQLCQF